MSEDFQSGEIGELWTFYGDPFSEINHSEGNPAPSFNNNGDSMWTSGIKSRETFSLKNGLTIECDVYLSCHPRGTWVSVFVGICDPLETSGNNEAYSLISIHYSYLGELNWHQPHLEGMLATNICRALQSEETVSLIHMNQWLDGWHRFKIEVSPDGLCSYFVDDSLITATQALLPDSLENVCVFLGGRATAWGTALHDNLEVYVP